MITEHPNPICLNLVGVIGTVSPVSEIVGWIRRNSEGPNLEPFGVCFHSHVVNGALSTAPNDPGSLQAPKVGAMLTQTLRNGDIIEAGGRKLSFVRNLEIDHPYV